MYIIVLLIFASHTLWGSPWELDTKTRDLLNAQIDEMCQKRTREALNQGRSDYMLDYAHKTLNINSIDCRYCWISEQLKRAHFKKRWPDQPEAHCFGSTLFLIQYLLDHPQTLKDSCTELLSRIENAPNFEEVVHFFSMNQHCYYAFEDLQDPLELHPELMQKFFNTLIGKTPSQYHVIPLSVDAVSFEKATIYATLKSLSNQLIMIGYSGNQGYNHCIAVSTWSEKLFIFDPNLGMYQYPDLETLSSNAEGVLKNCRFRWLAAFYLEGNPPQLPYPTTD